MVKTLQNLKKLAVFWKIFKLKKKNYFPKKKSQNVIRFYIYDQNLKIMEELDEQQNY